MFFAGMAISQAQTALYNTGNLRVHPNGQMGFHTDLINDGIFDENQGLVGFYSEADRNVFGAFAPTFSDVEFATLGATLLGTPLNLTNNANFVLGNVFSPRADPNVNLNFLAAAFYNGEGNTNKVDGFAAVSQHQNFTFPVGDGIQLRPLILNSEGVNAFAQCAYFSENPNNPVSIDANFDTDSKPVQMGPISTREFWRLEGNVASTIQISWNPASDIAALTDDINAIIPVGFSKAANQWVSLGSSGSTGTLDDGFTTSLSFVPNDYEAITFGALGEPTELLALDNYLVTPNGDGINDYLEIPELAQSPNNLVRIFNRLGLKVFEQANYTNEFTGLANAGTIVINQAAGLPQGVYYYIATLYDLDLEFQGFLYLADR
ncbi:MAG: gliding motility-associated C-terminal domain-containing protein [Flavobacteriaceae bacterium]